MMIRKYYGLNIEEKKAIITELAYPNCIGECYNHSLDELRIEGVELDTESEIYAKVYIDDYDGDLDDLTIDEIAEKYDISVIIRNCSGRECYEITESYKTGTDYSSFPNEYNEFDVYVDEQSPLYYDIIRDYMIERGHDWKWGEPEKCSIEHV